tara:strand:+ start:487 stop:1143 length:657 start_codon:yes stop_codon:yes gene_type:complete
MPRKVPGIGGMRGMGIFRTGRTKLSRSMESLNLGEVKSYLNARISGFKKTAHLETTFQAPKFSTNSISTKPFSKGEGAIIGSSNTEVACVFSAVIGDDGKTTVTKYPFNDTIPNFSDDYGAGCRVTLFCSSMVDDQAPLAWKSSMHDLLKSVLDNNKGLDIKICDFQASDTIQDIFVHATENVDVYFIKDGVQSTPAKTKRLTLDLAKNYFGDARVDY